MKKKKQPEPETTSTTSKIDASLRSMNVQIEALKSQIERLKKFFIDRHDESFYVLHNSESAADFEETADCLQGYVDSLDSIQNHLIELDSDIQEITKP